MAIHIARSQAVHALNMISIKSLITLWCDNDTHGLAARCGACFMAFGIACLSYMIYIFSESNQLSQGSAVNCSKCNKELNIDESELKKVTCKYCNQIFCDECKKLHIKEECEPLNEHEEEVKHAVISS